MAEIEASFATLTPIVDEIRMQSRAGALLWFHTEARPVPDPSGRTLYLQGVLMDITDRKRVEEALEASEFRYRTLVENVGLGITLIGSDYKIIMTNAGMGKIFGKPPQEFVGKYCFQEFEKRDGICPHCPGVKAMASGQPMEVDTIGVHDDGTFHYAHVRTFPTFDSLGNVTGFVEVVEDTTARRLVEAALEEERRQKEAILNNIPDIAWLKDKESQYLSVNEPFAKACGVSPQEMVGKNDLDIWPLDLAQKYRADDQEVIRTGNRKCFEELLMDTEKGMIWIETVKTPILNDKHEVIGTTGIARDITQRRQMEEALRESEKRFRDIIENAAEWIWEVDAEGNFTYASPVTEKVLGYKPEELLDKYFYDLYLPEERDQLRQAVSTLIEAKRPFRDLVSPYLHKNGEVVWLSVSGVPILEDQGKLRGYRGSGIDITERRRWEESLEDANKKLKILVQEADERNRNMALLNDMSRCLAKLPDLRRSF